MNSAASRVLCQRLRPHTCSRGAVSQASAGAPRCRHASQRATMVAPWPQVSWPPGTGSMGMGMPSGLLMTKDQLGGAPSGYWLRSSPSFGGPFSGSWSCR